MDAKDMLGSPEDCIYRMDIKSKNKKMEHVKSETLNYFDTWGTFQNHMADISWYPDRRNIPRCIFLNL